MTFGLLHTSATGGSSSFSLLYIPVSQHISQDIAEELLTLRTNLLHFDADFVPRTSIGRRDIQICMVREAGQAGLTPMYSLSSPPRTRCSMSPKPLDFNTPRIVSGATQFAIVSQ